MSMSRAYKSGGEQTVPHVIRVDPAGYERESRAEKLSLEARAILLQKIIALLPPVLTKTMASPDNQIYSYLKDTSENKRQPSANNDAWQKCIKLLKNDITEAANNIRTDNPLFNLKNTILTIIDEPYSLQNNQNLSNLITQMQSIRPSIA